ncbi:MAG: fatty acid desaturase, partial [Polyangiaceae bacterium]
MHPAIATTLIVLGLVGLYWFMLTSYVSIVLHRVIAHRAFSLPRWYCLAVTALSNSFIIYVNPRVWVAEHRLHHAHSDDGRDPDKRPGDGFLAWAWYLATRSPKASEPHLVQVSRDKIFDTRVMRWYSSPWGKWTSEATGFVVPYLALREV